MQNSSYFIKKRALFGCYPTQNDVDELYRNGVRYFVNLTEIGESRIFPYSVRPDCKEIKFPIRDHSLPRYWKPFSEFIHRISTIITELPPLHKIYIHCRGGHGRAGMVVAILLCRILKVDPIDAIKKTTEYHALRPNIKEKWKAIGSPHEYRQRAFVYRYFEPLNLYRIQYKEEYDSGFSRFSVHPFDVEGKRYSCLEGALLDELSKKTNCPASRAGGTIDFTSLNGKEAFTIRKIFDAIRCEKKKKLENKDTQWSRVRYSILKRLLLLKLDQHPHIKEKLLSSGFRQITMLARGNFTWPSGDGENVTGVILMEIRDDAYSVPPARVAVPLETPTAAVKE